MHIRPPASVADQHLSLIKHVVQVRGVDGVFVFDDRWGCAR